MIANNNQRDAKTRFLSEDSSSELYQSPANFHQAIDTDTAITRVGGSNCFQVAASLILIFAFTLNGQIVYGLAFLQDHKNVSINCFPRSDPLHSYICDQEQACSDKTDHYTFNRSGHLVNWITEAPGLLCYSSQQLSYQGIVYFVGFTLSSILWLRLTDIIGRKWLVFAGVISHLLINVIFLIKVNISTIYAYLSLIGFNASLNSHCAYLLLLQIVGPNYRSLYCALLNGLDGGAANVLLPLFYLLIKNWYYLLYFHIAYAAALILPIWFFIPQSPKFLISKQRFKQARRVYARIARCNKKQMFHQKLQGEAPPLHQIGSQASSGVSSMVDKKPIKQKGLKQLCKNKVLRVPLIVIPLIWFTVDLVYYGINFGLGNLKGSIYMNGLLSGGAECISYVISSFIANRLGRKWSIILCFMLGGLACIFYNLAIASGDVLTYICVLLGKFGSACTFNLVYLITTQMFPTVFRGTVFGIANVFARLGGIMSPFIDGMLPGSFMYIFGVLGVLSALSSFLLRQTKGQKMADTLEEQEIQDMKRKGTIDSRTGSLLGPQAQMGYTFARQNDQQAETMKGGIPSSMFSSSRKDPIGGPSSYNHQDFFQSNQK